MNKIYKLVKCKSTGLVVAVSELAKGAKKSGRRRLSAVALLGLFSAGSFAATGITQGYNPAVNDNKIGSVTVSGPNETIDLGLNQGFNSAQKGEEAERHTIRTEDSIGSLYKIKYQDVADAQANLDLAVKSGHDQTVIDHLSQILSDKKSAAAQISDDKLIVNDPNNLIGKNTEATRISDTTTKYKDPVTDKVFEITVKDSLVKTQAGSQVSGSEMQIDFYEKMPQETQYSDMQMVEVNGGATHATVTNGGAATNAELNAISKSQSGVIQVNDGANLTFDTDASYYTGSGKSTSTAFTDKDKYVSSTQQTLYEVTFKGTVNTALGVRTIDNEDDFNQFNKDLIKFIQNDEQIRLTYSTPEAMQAFYEQQIAGLYVSKSLGSYDVTYALTHDELEELAKQQGLENAFNNRVKPEDRGNDVGLESTENNYFIGVTGEGSVINITENANIKNSVKDAAGNNQVSAGTVIKADFDSSGATANNVFNIDGKIDANSGSAIKAKNAEINISATGVINGSISVTGQGANNGADQNSIDNKGTITGSTTLENGALTNHTGASMGTVYGENVSVTNQTGAIIKGSVLLGDNSSVDNSADITGSVYVGQNSSVVNQSGAVVGGSVVAHNNSTITNQSDAKITGIVLVEGDNAKFVNDGYAGGTFSKNGALTENNFIMLGSEMIKLENQSKLINNGDIYIGYQDIGGVMTPLTSGGKYSAISVIGDGSKLINNKHIHVAENQSAVNVVHITDGGEYSDTASSTLKINENNSSITHADRDTGNDNKAIFVSGANSKATVNGLIELNDIGSTGFWLQNGAQAVLNGIINLNGQNIKDPNDPTNPAAELSVRNFGAWAVGDGSKFTMNGNAEINMNADRAIGVHIRDGASAEINDNAGITFSDKKNQIGFLISGISQDASISYNSSQELKLKGEGSVLFRAERGSMFNENTISGSHDLSVLDSNGTKNSTLLVITNGAVANGASNQTHANLDGFTLKVNGEGAKGISVEGGAHASISDLTTVQLTGENSILAKVDGWYYDINGLHQSAQDGLSLLTSSATLTSSVVTGQNSVGYYLTNGGKLSHSGSVLFTSPSLNNIGVKIDSGGTLISESGSSVKVSGTAVEISGSTSLATINNIANGSGDPVIWAVGSTNSDAAYHVKDQANLTLTGAGLTKAEGSAHGILVDGASRITLDGAKLDLYGNGSGSSSGNGIENRSALTNIQFKNDAQIDAKDGIGIHSSVGFSQSSHTSGVINVHGGGTGISFEYIDPITGLGGGMTDNAISNTGYKNVVVNVLQQNGKGIYVNSSKNVVTSTSVNVVSQNGQSALIIEGLTEQASQSGNLHSANTASTIVDLNNGHMNKFTNDGDLLFGTFATGSGTPIFTATDNAALSNSYAVKTQSGENSLYFTNDSNGRINGVVELLGYGDKTNPTDKTKGNTVELKGAGNIFRTGEGNDTFIVRTVVGDDKGGANQVKQFTQLDGGAGDDRISFATNTDFTITKDSTLKNIEYVALEGSSKLTLDNVNSADGLNTGTTTYDIQDAASQLIYIWNNSAQNFDRQLLGNGTFTVDLQSNDHQFAFDNSHNTGAFTGTVELTNATYHLADSAANKNTGALTNATLKASAGSVIVVGDQSQDRTNAAVRDDQQIKGLTFNGGTVDFGRVDNAVDGDKALHHISVVDLALDAAILRSAQLLMH
jgi:autotransporter family porin